MAPELHYQLIVHRRTELQNEAGAHRRAREAVAGRKARESGTERRRVVFGKLRTT
ncbi:hypothetical protein [Sphaerisporangium sp. TRM90804]|uniref:hypothetical protein n=1 Tax=Sphaerisporangium sp. TRM90804 TaxID=3031113 RepID=UPI00244A6925|nr:hypothetical protein [Sphaerisporangium sp. TRM90804]MDH2429936.1 hypothetical protein [Sphaerisporangium sp. TRM90804]